MMSRSRLLPLLVGISIVLVQRVRRTIPGRVLGDSSIQTFEVSKTAVEQEIVTNSHETVPLPDWRIMTDCSAFALDCAVHAQSSGRYTPYPFDFTSNNIAKYKWKTLEKLPNSWKKTLDKFNSTKPLDVSSYYEFPPKVSKEDVRLCMKRARNSFDKQLDELLENLDRSLGMVSFTISDYKYARDMIHDVFEMAWNVVEFPQSFFMVALDQKSVKAACQYGYPVLSLGNATNSLKSKVANSKFEISKALVDRGVSFFFFEMDVFFIKSPHPWLENQTADLLVSSHQNNPTSPNIGVFSVLANDATREFFKYCIKWTEISPSTHDQLLMSSVWWANQHIQRGDKFNFGDSFNPAPPNPKFKYKYNLKMFGPHEIVADNSIIATERTIAIHPLCGTPLQSPHGKKWIAKELGAWYGFRGPNARGGYYHRQDEYRRFLWIDGRVLGGYSTVQGDEETGGWGLYHDEIAFRMTIATAIAVAQRSHRIFILPKLVRDWGVFFLWRELDLQSLESLVEVRETNFMSNPKSWSSPTTPLQSVARTALSEDGYLFAQYGENNMSAWKAPDASVGVDALFSISTAIPEIDHSEALLLNPYFMGRGYLDNLIDRFKHDKATLSIAEREILNVYKQLKWCHTGNDKLARQKASVMETNWDCYGQGVFVDL